MRVIYKNAGETPLEALERLRRERKIDKNTPLSYAGRLDPMAEGLLLVLVGEGENQERGKYLGLNKQYEFEVLFGLSTDTFDILGMAEDTSMQCTFTKEQLERVCERLEGEQEMKYPPFSSKTVDGEPLWKLAREGRIEKNSLPTQTVTLYRLTLEGQKLVDGKEILEEAAARIGEVSGDFRQAKIIATWKGAMMGKHDDAFPIVSFSLACSSGTYVRRIAQTMGEQLGCGAIAWHIKRTQIGDYTLDDLS